MSNTKKIVRFDAQARATLLSGVNILADAVKITMGPCGRNVVIANPDGQPVLTKDGVTVARAVNLSDKFPDIGVQLIKEAAARTADVAGDGTTTATVLAQSIFSEGLRLLAAGFKPSDVKKGIETATSDVLMYLNSASIPVTKDEEIRQVATISANGEREIGDLICSAISKVGRDGVVTVEEARGFNSSLIVVEGMQVDRGYLSPYFVTSQDKMVAELDKPYILLCNKKIDNIRELMPILEKIVETQRSLLIISDDIEGDAMQGLVVNKTRGSLKVCAIKAPGFGENRINMLNDLSVMIGADIISDATDITLTTAELRNLGTCKKVVVGRTSTIFVGCNSENIEIKNRISSIRSQLDDVMLDDDERMFLKLRLSRLSGGIAILRVGGATEAELGERKDRVDDALSATQAAIDEGILPGGGVALVRAASKLDTTDESAGVSAGKTIIKNACYSPLRQIVRNAGGSASVVLEKVLEESCQSHGYNAATEEYGDMLEMGIIDPTKVVKSAFENASSAASMMLTVGCAMVEDNEVDKLN
jgi:chaperonin GroEL